MTTPEVHCYFKERGVINPGASEPYQFASIAFDGPGHQGFLVTHYPPAVGDTFLGDDTNPPEFRIIERRWSWPQYGSLSWPYGQDGPSVGPRLEYICERVDGLYAGEAHLPGQVIE